jgi:ethylbenzene dioxygenase subunit beta
MNAVVSGVGTFAAPELREEVQQWQLLEAELLDDRREREWLENMVSREIVYQMPLRQTVERARGLGFVPGTFHLDERYGSLEARIARIETGYAWAEDPPSRVRHYVTNVRVGEGREGVVPVRSNLLIYRTRHDQTEPQLFSCERHDELVREQGALKLRRRIVYLDVTAIASHNLAIFF